MSQYGAGALSAKGCTFVDILQHYYRGAAIGAIPLRVGSGASLIPARVTFYAKKRAGVLYYVAEEADGDAAPRVSLNGKVISLAGVASGPHSGKRLAPEDLRAPGVNELTLWPDVKRPERRIRAWIELYPARGET